MKKKTVYRELWGGERQGGRKLGEALISAATHELDLPVLKKLLPKWWYLTQDYGVDCCSFISSEVKPDLKPVSSELAPCRALRKLLILLGAAGSLCICIYLCGRAARAGSRTEALGFPPADIAAGRLNKPQNTPKSGGALWTCSGGLKIPNSRTTGGEMWSWVCAEDGMRSSWISAFSIKRCTWESARSEREGLKCLSWAESPFFSAPGNL